MTKIVNACCALYNIALDNGCFDGLCDEDTLTEEYIAQTLNDQHSIIDGPEHNSYYKLGSIERDEMMKNLPD